MTVVFNLKDAGQMLAERGLQKNGYAQKLFTAECIRYMDDYVPSSIQVEHLRKNLEKEPDKVTYNTPYARYHYYGKLMLAPNGSSWARHLETKHLTDIDMHYYGAPKRGPYWDKRMWADKKLVIVRTVAEAVGGRAK